MNTIEAIIRRAREQARRDNQVRKAERSRREFEAAVYNSRTV